MATVGNPKPTEDYLRLQNIEKKIIACVRIAAEVMEHFAAVGRTTELAPVVQELCTRFMTTITEALQLVKEGVEASSGDHRLELHAYHSLARAHINTEKLQVMRMHLKELQACMEEAGAWPEQQQQQQEGSAQGQPQPQQQPAIVQQGQPGGGGPVHGAAAPGAAAGQGPGAGSAGAGAGDPGAGQGPGPGASVAGPGGAATPMDVA